MRLLEEIQISLASTRRDYAIPIQSINQNYPAWIIRYHDWHGVGVPYGSQKKVSEKFSNVRMRSQVIVVGEKEINMLLLLSNIEELRYEFSSICANFVEPGKSGLDRIKLTENPMGWWSKWKELLGNHKYDKETFSILGEMVVYEKLLTSGCRPNWSLLSYSTYDFELNDTIYEVKSTKHRYGSTITVNSQFQMVRDSKKFYLTFCRFEESDAGLSISDMVNRLGDLGVDKSKLNWELKKRNLEEGCSAREEKYKILEVRKYTVDNEFPVITSDSFVDNKIPKGIVQIVYKVDLSGFQYENWT